MNGQSTVDSITNRVAGLAALTELLDTTNEYSGSYLSDEEYLTVSECTCTPISRSSSYNTASECELPWRQKDSIEVVQTQRVRFSKEGCTIETESVSRSKAQLSLEADNKKIDDGDGEDNQECRDWLELKVVDVNPCLTQLADTLEEAIELRNAHAEVIKKIQSKKSPVTELQDQAESVLANQNTSPKVYSAMTDSLTAVWQNVNHHLEARARILDLNVAYHRCAEEFFEYCNCLEGLATCDIPVEIQEIRERIEELKEGLRLCLIALNSALNKGSTLIELLSQIETQPLDSRPQHIQLNAQLAKLQVERWLERLHMKRIKIQETIESSKTQLEQCLTLTLITSDLTLLKQILTERTEAILNTKDELGDETASAQLLLFEHKKMIPEAKDFQEQALKIVRATEDFASGGHFAGPEALREAFLLLELAATYLHHIDQRENMLMRSIDFFNNAQSALIKLDQLEVQLSTGDLGLGFSQTSQLHSNVAKSLDEATAPAIDQGYSLLSDAPGAQGVKRVVEQIENKKIHLSVQCTAHKEENVKANQAYSNFIGKHGIIHAFLTSMDEYLKGVREVGEDLSSAKGYLQIYRKNINDIQIKGTEINALISTIPGILDIVDQERGNEIKSKGDTLRELWSGLTLKLERRIRHCSSFTKVHDLSKRIIDDLETVMKSLESGDETMARTVWVGCQQSKAQFDNTLANFNKDSREVGTDGGLDLETARQCLIDLSSEIASRVSAVDEKWKLFTDENERRKQERQRDRQLWETNMAASNKTVDWVSKLDAQLYPVLNPELHSARQLSNHVEEKLNTVVPEIKRAQQEIKLRIETAEALLKEDLKGNNDAITVRLKELNSRLQTISAEYQILLEKLLTFFKNLSQVENRVETLQKEQKTLQEAHNLDEALSQLRDFEVNKHAIAEMFNLCLIENGHINNKIKSQEGIAADSDIRTIDRAVDTLRYNWQRICTTRESELSKQEARCRFDQDILEADQSLHTLASQLAATRGRYGESLSEAKATSEAFATFEKTIQLLEVRLNEFANAGKELTGGERGEHIEKELSSMKNMWKNVKDQVLDTRRRINLALVFFKLVEEAEEWFKEGNKVLLSIAQRSAKVQSPQEAQELLKEIEVFLKPGEQKQNERIEQITNLALELYGEDVEDHLKLVKSSSKDMLDSFRQISETLNAITERINTPEPIVEFMEMEESPKVIEDWHSTQMVTQISSTTFQIENINVQTEERPKSPSPPLKKTKYVEVVGEAPVFVAGLQNSCVDEGSRFTFECRVTGNPIPDIVWEKDGIKIQNPDYKVKYDDGLCMLTIEETFSEDSSKFTCKASNFVGNAETSAYLSVRENEPEIELVPSSFVIPLSNIHCLEGDKLELRCQVAGVPLPTVQWFHSDKCLDNEPNHLITFNNGEAKFLKENVKAEDQGEYSCIATNPKGTKTSSAKVVVRSKIQNIKAPVFNMNLSSVMVRAGDKVELACRADGTPKPTLSWFKDGKEINDKEIKANDDGSTTLTIVEAFPKDSGRYSVTATNDAGTVSTICQVIVKGKPIESDTDKSDMEPAKPKVQLHLRDQSVFEGKKVRLDCVIVGVPEPEVIWYHNDQPVKESADFQLIFQGDRCSLIIQEALLEDSGTYKVKALNSMGETSSQCTLNIQAVDKSGEHQTRKIDAPVAQVEGAPKFTQLLSDLLIVAGDTVQFECTVTGQPLPTVSWALNNKELMQSDKIHMSQDMDGHCLLRVMNVNNEDKGVYTAKAINQQGEAKCFSHLTVKTPLTLESIKPQVEDVTSPPYFTELFADSVAGDGTSVKFECIVNGKPTPKIKWLFNSQPVSGKDFLVSTSGNRQVLSLPSINKNLAGQYTCMAENEAGKASCVANLTVTEGVDLKSVDNIDLDSGVFELKRAVFMQSESTSHFSSQNHEPVVKIQSTVSKSEVASHKIGDQPAVQVEMHKTSEYKNIDGVESKEESQVFKTSEDNGKKFVIGKRKPLAPRFISPLNGCIVDQGADVTLTAIVEGHPSPEIKWARNNNILKDVDATWEFGKAILKLKNVNNQHGGRYTCTATNEAGTAASSADVVVKKSQFPPVLGRRLQARTAAVGERVAMEVEVTGTPTPTVSWSKDGQPIRPTSTVFRIINQGNCHTLIIDKVDHIHTGQYGAVATNSAGEARSTADLLVIDPPLDSQPKLIFSDLGSEFQPQTVSAEGGMVVTESVKSEKHVSMKVHKSEVSLQEVNDFKKNFSETKTQKSEFKTIKMPEMIDIPKPTFDASKFNIEKSSLEKIETNLGTFEIPKYEKNDDLVTDSISTKSSLDFFKSIIKENEKVEPKVAKKEFQSSFAQFNNFHKETKEEFSQPEFFLEPGPPPEMGFIPKSTTAVIKDDMASRLKKLEESQRDLRESEIPSGGVKIFPTTPKKEIQQPIFHKKDIEPKIENIWEGRKEIFEHFTQEKVILPNEPVLRPCADLAIRPLSPRPSAEGVSMEKLWASKKEEIRFADERSTMDLKKTDFTNKKEEKPIFYVAEAHATHKTNVSKRSDFFESYAQRSQFSQNQRQIENDVHIEPGPPPEIGFATPPPKERRQSYVEQVEQELEKDLEKMPSRHLAGAVRLIPLKKEKCVESSFKKVEKRSSSFGSESFKPFPALEPFPFKPDVAKESPTKFSTLPRVTKFTKKSTESDYESDLDCKIKARWTPWDSDTEEPHYRKVKPPSFQPRSQSAQPEPPPPSAFSQPKPDSPKIKKRPVQDSGYMADTDEPRQKSRTEIFTKKTSQVNKESQEIKQTLEPFPFKPSEPIPAPRVTVPLASPSKFIKGDFKSDHESEYETRIPSVWGQDSDKTFRPVKPHVSPQKQEIKEPPKQLSTILDQKIHKPQPHYFDLKPGSPPKIDYAPPVAVETSNTMNFAESTANSRRVVTMQKTTRVISYDNKSYEKKKTLPVKIIPKGEIKYVSDSESEKSTDIKAEEKRLQRVEEMKKRFIEKKPSLIEIQPGEPPQFDYAPPLVPAVAATVANKHINEMTSTFKTKAQQFVSELQPKNDEPQIYREESRHSEKGTKCIDPDTGLIYFKYDFGYEFGVLLPGEGKKFVGGVKKLPQPKRLNEREDGSIEVKVIHETTKPKFKSVKWDPTSESELSDAEDVKRKLYRPQNMQTQSPMSISPCLSPYYTPAHETQGAQNWANSSQAPLSAPIVVNAMLHSEAPKKSPIFITPLRDIAVVSGQTARFECIVQAEPSPEIVWAKDGRIVEPSLSHDVQFRNGVCRLTLPQAFSYDAGTYTCTATNNIGMQITSATLQVSGEERTYISK